jgi:hypothetical protein
VKRCKLGTSVPGVVPKSSCYIGMLCGGFNTSIPQQQSSIGFLLNIQASPRLELLVPRTENT